MQFLYVIGIGYCYAATTCCHCCTLSYHHLRLSTKISLFI